MPPLRLSKKPILADDFRKSLDILLGQNIEAQVPTHKQFVTESNNRTKGILEQIRQMQMQRYTMPNIQGPQNGGGENYSPVGKSGGTLDKFISAIAGKESGGNYGAVNRSSGALGKYQIMPGNIRGWSREILGYSITPQQFLRSPQLQEQIARGKLTQYYNKYGAAGAAVAWYAGPGAVRSKMNSTRNQGGYPSIQNYWQDILRRMR